MEEDIFQIYLKEIDRIKGCTQEENERLIRLLGGGDKAVKSRLIEGNLKAVLEMVPDYFNLGVQAGDLVQEANMALVLAVEEYDEGWGRFEDYLKRQVKDALAAVVEEQSQTQKAGQKVLDRVNALKDVSQEMAVELGREATVEELACRMGLTGEEIKEIMKWTLDAMKVMGEA